ERWRAADRRSGHEEFDPVPERPPAKGFSRREVLSLVAGSVISIGALAGCRPSTRNGQATKIGAPTDASTATAGGPSAPAVDARRDGVVARAAANERALIAAYDAALTNSASSALAAKLRALREDHARHLDGLVPGASASLTPTPTPAPAASSPATSSPATSSPATSSPATAVARSSRALSASRAAASSPSHATALAHLANLEHAAAAARLDDLAGTPGSLARLVASIGACEAAHEALLKVMT
ncbi:MAG: hypothetical protein ACREMU_03185, partial [Gemmatimonadaceae bacterium]